MYGMDSSTMSLLGFGVVVIVSAIAMYLVSLFTMKETSFEAVLEEQKRKKDQEDKERSLQNKKKREMYKKRFDLKKKKIASGVGNGKVEKVDSGVSPMHTVQIKETPRMESGEPAALAPEPKKMPKGRGPKKQQETQQTDGSPKPSHPILKQAVEKPKDQPRMAEMPQKKEESGRTRNVSFSDEVQETQKSEDQEKSKKKKKKEIEVENEIVSQLREATLSDRDVQNILTWIKQKYAIDVGGGNKIKDLQHQLDLTEKQLNQCETNLQQYVNRCMAAESKIEQLKQDLIHEKTKGTSLEKALQDSEANRIQEIASIRTNHEADMKQIKDKIAMAADYEEKCRTVEQMKSEKKYLVAEIQKNANIVGEKARLSSDLQQVQSQLQESNHRCSELEAQLQQNSTQSEAMQHAQGEKENRILLQMSEQANAHQQMRQSYTTLDAELQKIKVELQGTQSNSTKLLEQVTSLTEDNDAKTEALRALEQRLAESDQTVTVRDSQLQDETQRNAELSTQVKELEQQIMQLNSEIVKIEQVKNSMSAADAQSVVDAQERKKLQEEVEIVKKEKSTLKEEVDRLKKKNNDLRERSWKTMDTLTNMEKSIPKKVAAAKAEGEVRCENLKSSVRQSLTIAFPDVSINEESFEAWVEVFTKQASESAEPVQSTSPSPELLEARSELQQLRAKFDETSAESAELESKICALESSVKRLSEEKNHLERDSQEELSNAIAERERYKRILSSTEEILGKLQSSVEVEERGWRKKVEEAQRESFKVNQDADILRKAVNELKTEKTTLEETLRESEESKKRLEKARNEVLELKEQLKTAKVAVNGDQLQTEEHSDNDGSAPKLTIEEKNAESSQ